MKKLFSLVIVALVLFSAHPAYGVLTLGATSVVSDAGLSLQGTAVNITGDTTLTGTLIFPTGSGTNKSRVFASSVLSDLVRRVYLSFNMGPTSSFNSFTLDDTSVLGTTIAGGSFAGNPRFDFLWSPPAASPATAASLMNLSGSATSSATHNGYLSVGSSTSGGGTGGFLAAGGSGIGYSLNTPGDVGYIYPLSASTIGIGFRSSFGARPDSAVVSIAASGVSIGTHLTLGPATSHLISSQTTAPAPSVTGTDYASAAIGAGSSDTKGAITATVGAAVGTLVVTFQTPYTSAPICTVSPATATAQVDAGKVYVTTSTTALTLNFVATPTGGSETWNYICVQ